MSLVGIDFGTTNSAISTAGLNGAISTLGPFPSVGVWKNGDVSFFKEARDMLKSQDKSLHVIRDLKMQLGDSDVVIGRDRVSTVELSAQLIRGLVEKAVPGKVDLAVLSTPIKFSRNKRQALLDAANRAGLENVRLVYEPTAALVGAIEEHDQPDGVSLIVDWGGGTLDIAVVKKSGSSYRELAVGGDSRSLGGSEIDRRVAEDLIATHKNLARLIDQDDGNIDRFLEEVEEAKHEIMESPFGASGDVLSIVPDWAEADVVVDLEDHAVFDLVTSFAEEAREQIGRLLRENGIQTNEIRYVVFAGGVCNSLDARKVILELFPNARAVTSKNPQLLTAEGCAKLASTGFDIELACNFGVRQSDDSFCSLLPYGTRLDATKHRTARFLLTDAYAPEVIFEFGVSRDSIEGREALGTSVSSYSCVGNLFIKAPTREWSSQPEVPDRLRLYAGIDNTLTLTVHVRSEISDDGVTDYFTGIPLAISQCS
jgi:molecular chaperone DnaK (HSP70)